MARKMKEKAYITPDSIDAKESSYLTISASRIPNADKGLFVCIPIYKNEVISRYKGEILTESEAADRTARDEDRYYINMTDGSTMDSMNVKCYAKYANDAEGFCRSGFKNNSEITLDENDKVCLVAKRNIKAGEEIFCAYGKAYWKNHKIRLESKP